MEIFKNTVFGKLQDVLQQAVAAAGYRTPTPVQEKTIPLLLKGSDVVASAQTGTGKTAAFMLPILNTLVRLRKPRRIGKPRALVLSPTRELALQTALNTKTFLRNTEIPVACLIGGVSQYAQIKDIKKGAEVVIACPGRLIDLMTQGVLYLDLVECFVLDEADRMLDMGFLPDIKRIISKLPVKRQSMFFSATMPPEVKKLASELVHDPEYVEISPGRPVVEKINQFAVKAERPLKNACLIALLRENPSWNKVVVFVKMRHSADRVQRKLQKAGIAAAAIHSDKTQNQRTRALEAFKSGENRVLVATDIASRGIDVSDVVCVVNMDLPLELESYVHRIGRTARAGSEGTAVSLVSSEEMPRLKDIERFIRKTIHFRAAPQEAEPFAGCASPAGNNKVNDKKERPAVRRERPRNAKMREKRRGKWYNKGR